MRPTLYLVLILFAFSCKEESSSPLPQVLVNEVVFLNTVEAVPLRDPGGFIMIEGGVRGIVVVNTFDGVFRAFDRLCTYDPNEPCATLQPDLSNIRLVDTCCGSVFSMQSGLVVSGPATVPLIQYQVSQVGNRLDIVNQ